MSEQTIHIKTPISRDDLDAVIIGLELACGGARIEINEAFDLVVKDERQVAALKALFGSNGSKPEDVTPRRKKNKNIRNKPGTPGPHSYVIEASGEVISSQALNGRLAEHSIEVGTRLKHPKKGVCIIVAAENETGPYRVVEAGKWEASHE